MPRAKVVKNEGELKIEYVPLDQVQKWPRTPKNHDLDTLEKSISRFGFVQPVIVDGKSNRLVAGHGRLEALLRLKELGGVPPDRIQVDKKTGAWLLPVLSGVQFASEADAEAYLIADNRLVELGGWDESVLTTMLQEFSVDQLTGVGYQPFEIDDMVELLEHNAERAQILEDGEIIALKKKTISKRGDIWVLGSHRLACGDCGEESVLDRLFGTSLWDLLITDPPYGVDYAGKNAYLNTIDWGNRIQTDIEGDKQTPVEMFEFWKRSFSAVKKRGASDGSYYITGPQVGDLLLLLLQAISQSELTLKHMLIWVKNNHVLGRSDYNYKHEPIIYGWIDKHDFYGPSNEVTTWEIAKPHVSDLHPTMKPIELYARAMRNSSTSGDIVFDPFAGAGPVFIAAEQLNRVAYGVEIDPAYCDVIITRWETFSGKKAKRLK
jgi:DNA modification methylase